MFVKGKLQPRSVIVKFSGEEYAVLKEYKRVTGTKNVTEALRYGVMCGWKRPTDGDNLADAQPDGSLDGVGVRGPS